MKNISVLALFPKPLDSTSWYRGAGVFSEIRKHADNVSVTPIDSHRDWDVVKNVDLVFMQRPWSRNHLSMMAIAQTMGIPVWIDYDDDLLSVPESNNAWYTYASPDIRQCVQALQERANMVSVTTAFLASRIKNDNVVVVPNAYDEKTMRRLHVSEMKRQKIVFWRGSDTHFDDLMSVGPQIVNVAKRHSDWQWCFAGWNPSFITRLIPGCQYMPFRPVLSYLDYLKKYCPQIMVFPLFDSPFNRSKSNCSWLEGTYAGSAFIAPQWDEWQKPGITNYTTPQEFEEKLEHLIEHYDESLSEASYQYIQENLLLSEVTKLRLDIIKKLV